MHFSSWFFLLAFHVYCGVDNIRPQPTLKVLVKSDSLPSPAKCLHFRLPRNFPLAAKGLRSHNSIRKEAPHHSEFRVMWASTVWPCPLGERVLVPVPLSSRPANLPVSSLFCLCVRVTAFLQLFGHPQLWPSKGREGPFLLFIRAVSRSRCQGVMVCSRCC